VATHAIQGGVRRVIEPELSRRCCGCCPGQQIRPLGNMTGDTSLVGKGRACVRELAAHPVGLVAPGAGARTGMAERAVLAAPVGDAVAVRAIVEGRPFIRGATPARGADRCLACVARQTGRRGCAAGRVKAPVVVEWPLPAIRSWGGAIYVRRAFQARAAGLGDHEGEQQNNAGQEVRPRISGSLRHCFHLRWNGWLGARCAYLGLKCLFRQRRGIDDSRCQVKNLEARASRAIVTLCVKMATKVCRQPEGRSPPSRRGGRAERQPGRA